MGSEGGALLHEHPAQQVAERVVLLQDAEGDLREALCL